MQLPWPESLLILYARKFPIRRGKMRVVNALWPLVTRRRDDQRTASLIYGNFRMQCDLNETLQRQYYFFGTYFLEDHLLQLWSSLARNATVVADVGANAGIYSLAALAANSEAEVHAFEPTPEIAKGLTATAKLNGLSQLNIHQVAVSDVAGRAFLVRFDDHGANSGMNFISETESFGSSEYTDTLRLDDFCRDRGIDHIDLLKLDIQGHEHRALRGAQDLLMSGRVGHVFLELNWSQDPDADSPASEAVALLESAGYLFSAPERRLQWRPSGSWMRALTDVIAARKPATVQ